MIDYPDRMTYLDLVKKHIPDADDSFADLVLWDKTDFPFVKNPKTLERQIVEFAKGLNGSQYTVRKQSESDTKCVIRKG